jgi:adenosylcobyric acid synthase
LESYARLAAKYDLIVLEGAGSPAEINLKSHDIVNMRMAEAANASCLLIGDIDRGGVFASLFGTLELLEAEERKRVRGYLINKFRGDVSLLKPGLEMIKPRINIPCLGVIPYLPDVGLDEEDGVAVEQRKTPARVWRDDDETPDRRLRVGVIALPHMSNFTDFDALAAEPSVALAYLNRATEVKDADIIILPGTKQTINDLRWLRTEGFDQAIQSHVTRGFTIGVCGGMQILGWDISDPAGLEGGGEVHGLGLLPISTSLESEKITRPATAQLLTETMFGQTMSSQVTSGYEIHLGVTKYLSGSNPLFELRRKGDDRSLMDGVYSADHRVVGTYLHGLFDDDQFRHAFVSAARAACKLNLPAAYADVKAERDARFDRLAEHVRGAINLDEIRAWLKIGS